MPINNDNSAISTELAVSLNTDVRDFLFSEKPISTRKEMNVGVRLFHSSGLIQRQTALSMFERQAHKVVGLPWEKFAADFLHISEGKYSYELLDWARVERAVLRLNESAIADSTAVKLPKSVARQLAKLPDADLQIEAYGQLRAIQDQAVATPREAERELTKIVARMLAPSVPPSPIPAIEATRPKSDFTPVVPETYDRGPEFDFEPTLDEIEYALDRTGVPESEIVRHAPTPAEPDIDAPHKYPAVEVEAVPTEDPRKWDLRIVPTALAVADPAQVVSLEQYNALLCIAKAFAAAVDTADSSAALETRLDFKRFLREFGS